jgi:hypothetical protein
LEPCLPILKVRVLPIEFGKVKAPYLPGPPEPPGEPASEPPVPPLAPTTTKVIFSENAGIVTDVLLVYV